MNLFSKNLVWKRPVMVVLISLLFLGCKKEESDKVVVMTISPELVWGGVRPPGNPEDLVQVMECKIDNTGEILHLWIGEIEGFDYVEGFTYKLKVKIVKISNPPADASSVKYVLVEVLSKV